MRIFVSVGTHPQPFDRLLKQLDLLLHQGKLKAEVFAQIGSCGYKPKKFSFEKLLDDKRYSKEFRQADIVISHGGAGTIINALRNEKPLIIAPRLYKFNEHTNDHQLDLALALDERGKAIAVKEMGELENAIKTAAGSRKRMASERHGLIKEIKSFLGASDK